MTKYGFQGVMPDAVPYNTDTGVGIYQREKCPRGIITNGHVSRPTLMYEDGKIGEGSMYPNWQCVCIELKLMVLDFNMWAVYLWNCQAIYMYYMYIDIVYWFWTSDLWAVCFDQLLPFA